jgi:L-lactate utilization protein LutB
MHKVIQLISIFLYNKNMPPSMKVRVNWTNSMKNQIIQKYQSFESLKERASRQKTHVFNHLTKQLCSMGSKCLTLGACHMCRK